LGHEATASPHLDRYPETWRQGCARVCLFADNDNLDYLMPVLLAIADRDDPIAAEERGGAPSTAEVDRVIRLVESQIDASVIALPARQRRLARGARAARCLWARVLSSPGDEPARKTAMPEPERPALPPSSLTAPVAWCSP
jgi:hypothetical protein